MINHLELEYFKNGISILGIDPSFGSLGVTISFLRKEDISELKSREELVNYFESNRWTWIISEYKKLNDYIDNENKVSFLFYHGKNKKDFGKFSSEYGYYLYRLNFYKIFFESIYFDLTQIGNNAIFIEDYSFGAKSNNVFHLGELGGVIKTSLYDEDINSISAFNILQIKKFWTGNGSAKKIDMLNSFRGNISEILFNYDSYKKVKGVMEVDSPLSDIIDSYSIAFIGYLKYVKRYNEELYTSIYRDSDVLLEKLWHNKEQ
jgi:hypothetical protein